MNKNPKKHVQRYRFASRAGAATIEFVFALPFLLLLMVSLTWLGFSMLYQAEVNVEARQAAWQQRYENENAEPFVFTTHPSYDPKNDFAKGESEHPVNVSRLFDAMPDPQATEFVLAGTWDHRALPLDGIPNWRSYAKAVVNAKTGDIQSLLGGMDSFQNAVSDIGANLLRNQLKKLASTINPLSGSNNNSLQETAKDATAAEGEEKKRVAKERKIVLIEEIKNLNKIKKEQADKLNPVQERKLFRLESELRDVKSDLKGLA